MVFVPLLNFHGGERRKDISICPFVHFFTSQIRAGRRHRWMTLGRLAGRPAAGPRWRRGGPRPRRSPTRPPSTPVGHTGMHTYTRETRGDFARPLWQGRPPVSGNFTKILNCTKTSKLRHAESTPAGTGGPQTDPRGRGSHCSRVELHTCSGVAKLIHRTAAARVASCRRGPSQAAMSNAPRNVPR